MQIVAVVPVEKAIIDGHQVRFTAPARKHDNLRFSGEDFK